MNWDWLTTTTAPWWSPVVASLLTFLLGNVLSNRSAAKQRTADSNERKAEREHEATERAKEREHEAAEAKRERDEAADREAAEMAARSEAALKARRFTLATEATDAIGALQASIAASVNLVHKSGPPIDADVLANFLQTASRLRLATDDTFSPDPIRTKVGQYLTDFEAIRNSEVLRPRAEEINNDLSAMASEIVSRFWTLADSV